MKEDDELDFEEFALTHVLLPRKLPEKKPSYLQQLELMTKFVAYVETIADNLPRKTIEMIRKFRTVQTQCSEAVIADEIKGLRPGDTFAMFVRRQNCTIMIYMPPNQNQNVILATFPGNLPMNEIYRHGSDIEFNYPSNAIKVKFSNLLCSKEFANQLYVLNESVVKAKHKDYVSRWLTTLLADEESTTASSSEFINITKKVRDELVAIDDKKYFRRSRLYMSVKVLLQHSLTMQLGAKIGKFLYKIAMLKFMVDVCEPYSDASSDIHEVELLSQMIAKLARRIEKLSHDKPDPITNNFFDATITEAKEAIDMIRSKIDNKIREYHEEKETEAKLPPLKNLELEDDVVLEMPNLIKYMNSRAEEPTDDDDNGSTCNITSFHRVFVWNWSNLNETLNTIENDVELRIFWTDFENLVLHRMNVDNGFMTGDDFRKWSFEYAKYAEKYKDNPLCTSRMILVYLKIVAILDHRAMKEFPLLKIHHSGVNPNVINSLLLPHRADMEIAHELEQLFRERNRYASHPSLIEDVICNDSFSVKFVTENIDMMEIRDKILEQDEENVKLKKSERDDMRILFETTMATANTLTCQAASRLTTKRRHLSQCERCRLIAKAHGLKMKPYTRLLPNDVLLQKAVVFELGIPNLIACLRDVLYGFNNIYFDRSTKIDIQQNWIENAQFAAFNNTTSKHVMLGSTIPQSKLKHPVNNDFSVFVVDNGGDCIFHVNKKGIPRSSESSIKKACTFKIKTNDEYACLQWTLNSTSHFQNDVLARQYECPHNLSIPEYRNFGSLRADGHRLQLQKMNTMIETETLSFEKESVLLLIIQTLWECGVIGDGKSIRESHIDFSNRECCSRMIESLDKFVVQQKANWKHPRKLIMATLVAARVFEINETDSIAIQVIRLLNKIRDITVDWMNKIERAIRDMKNPDENAERELRLKLIHVAIAGALTFNIHPKHKYFNQIFADTTNELTSFQAWLQFIIILKCNIQMYISDEKQLPSNLRMFVRLIEVIGINLQPVIKTMLNRNSNNLKGLIKKQWSLAEGALISNAYFHGTFGHILVAEATKESHTYTISIDTITGAFLIDGLPISRLPIEIMQSNIYQLVFGIIAFQVQPDGRNHFHTVQTYNGCKYEFIKYKQNVIITEHRAGDVEKELINSEVFECDFPHLLIVNYTHWWNKRKNCIEFRQKAPEQMHFSTKTKIDYILDMNTFQLKHTKTGRFMLYIHSKSYSEISKQLSRLERSKYIHMFLQQEMINGKWTPRQIDVELVRINLKFKIDCSVQRNYHLVSNEFHGMRVSGSQKIGTLYGLNHVLVLESISKVKSKMLLIPHGNIVTECDGEHATVRIEIENDLQKPPFYQYQVDEFCKQLKSSSGSYASWFYLAYLHSVTSHGEVEPFTGMSGTERALQILQSSFVWSSSPYDSESIRMLNAISKLSPIRKLNGNHQIITWPKNLPPRSAQDSFVFIATKLFEDSQRLHLLYSKDAAQKISFTTELRLNRRDYHRCLQLNLNLRVSDTFIKHKVMKTSLAAEIAPSSFSKTTRTISILYHRGAYDVPANLNLKKFLTLNRTDLSGIDDVECAESILSHSNSDALADVWICLYDLARRQKLTNAQFAIIFSLFAHRNEEIGPIQALQAVAMNPQIFNQINPPAAVTYNISAGAYSERKVTELMNKYAINPQNSTRTTTILDDLVAKIQCAWPCDEIQLPNDLNTNNDVDIKGANKAINIQLQMWNNNRLLGVFIKDVQKGLKSLRSPTPIIDLNLSAYAPFADQPPKCWAKYSIDPQRYIRQRLYKMNDAVNEANDVWEMKTRNSLRSAIYWWNIIKNILHSDESQHLVQSELIPRMVPSLLLPKILDQSADVGLKALIGAWAVQVTREQRQKRIEMLEKREEHLMAKETENEPHLNWKPCDYPEWLIFEIEQNLTIRRIQVEIAKRMINPPEIAGQPQIKHAAMQLNCGEGKTGVIVPILAAVLANGSQACQITVLKPLFSTNLKALRRYLGALLNNRIYTFPCRRDMPIGRCIKQISEIYQECLENKGVILTLPEHRLSFQLKIYESVIKGEIDAGKRFLDVHKWINANVRNILDESDAILQPNSQMIYTIGHQELPDGESLRWLVPQAILKRVPYHLKKLIDRFGTDKIEFDDNYIKSGHIFGAQTMDYRPDVFTPCRILDETVFYDLRAALIDDFSDNKLDIQCPETNDEMKTAIRYMLCKKDVDKGFVDMVKTLALNERRTIFILSGLLRFEVLKLALTRRWRVNYGVNLKGHRKMAIPFKAKDVAAEMTEFGHPDVAICLTQLSYYYSGLTDDQLRQLFDTLAHKQNAPEIYNKWIKCIDSKLIHPSIKSYVDINLDDPFQRDTCLFPLLRFNMYAIDFWLENSVFQYEAKISQKKLMCTAWDLCSDHLQHRVTGFSGTNDTKNILPLPIAQNDLEELENTNKNVRKVLLENNDYRGFKTSVSGKQILEQLTERNIPVLLDSGALVLELTNEQVAVEWLKLTFESDYDAAVYFDSHDILQTIDRNGVVTEFDYSVYRDNLSRCLVYLDDVHTRGTDLKFPMICRACVTLSGEITRDKTVQSCMRMRELGKGHTVTFWASYEADTRIRKICELSPKQNINNEHVIKFIEANSDQFEMANMSHWGAAALNYTKKMVGHKLYDEAVDRRSMESLAQICADNEIFNLSEMYGEKMELHLKNILLRKFSNFRETYMSNRNIRKFIQNTEIIVFDKIDEYAPDVKQFSHSLDEEQEKELELELEEHRYVHRPPNVTPAKPSIDFYLKELIVNGATDTAINNMKQQNLLFSIVESLKHTQLYDLCKNNDDAWAAHLLVTRDFKMVVDLSSKQIFDCNDQDQFIRPVWWIARIENEVGKDILLLLSSFECERLLSDFQTSTKSTLFMYRPRVSNLQRNRHHETKLQITGITENASIDIEDEIQIATYSGVMYFNSDAEQNAYCGFLGLIPHPKTAEQQFASQNGWILSKGFVPSQYRQFLAVDSVKQCKFKENPVGLAIKLVEAQHQTLIKESHVALILLKGKKVPIE